MLNNPTATLTFKQIRYPIHDSTLPFSDYIKKTRFLIQERRLDLEGVNAATASTIIEANSPYEFTPTQTTRRIKYGALLIHGLLDCPFSLRDLGMTLRDEGVLCRSLLLPGHGTRPDDLISISYHDWIQALRYGVESMKRDVDHLFLIGYSTGAALSIYQSLIDHDISGMVLLAPAIRLRVPINIAVLLHQLKKSIGLNGNPWLIKADERDYAKYKSIAFNPVTQVSLLTTLIKDIRLTRNFHCPMFLAVSDHDETISYEKALQFFSHHPHELNQFLLYTNQSKIMDDPRIIVRSSLFPELHIKHFSHISIPFAPNNPHYGQHGDYVHASRLDASEHVYYGAYNKLQTVLFDKLYDLELFKSQRHTLTYNPDFPYMSQAIYNFMMKTCA